MSSGAMASSQATQKRKGELEKLLRQLNIRLLGNDLDMLAREVRALQPPPPAEQPRATAAAAAAVAAATFRAIARPQRWPFPADRRAHRSTKTSWGVWRSKRKGPNSRRRDCHFAGTPSSSLLKRLLTGEGGAAE